MRRPKQPNNPYFWMGIVKDPAQVARFEEQGNARQLRELDRAIRYSKWNDIQIRKTS